MNPYGEDSHHATHESFYGGNNSNFYDPTSVGAPMYEDVNMGSVGPFGPASPPVGYPHAGPFIPAGNAAPAVNLFNPVTGGTFDPNAGMMNPNLLYSAGTQLFANQASSVLNQYAQDFQSKGKTWVGSTLKYYFAVDTSYVLRKLFLLFCPFTHKDWSIRFNPNDPVAPRDDINSPDLYIPCMAYVTYILVAGFLIGTTGDFSPEKLGVQASYALAWLVMEVLVVRMALYLLGITSSLGFFHLLAFSSYKFVPMIAAILIGYVVSSTAYYGFLIYASLALAFFLMRSVHVTIQTTSIGSSSPKNSLGLVFCICALQVFVMYWLTRQFVGMSSIRL